MRPYGSGFTQPVAAWYTGVAPAGGPAAATAMMAATTKSTGITSHTPSGIPGKSRITPRP